MTAAMQKSSKPAITRFVRKIVGLMSGSSVLDYARSQREFDNYYIEAHAFFNECDTCSLARKGRSGACCRRMKQTEYAAIESLRDDFSRLVKKLCRDLPFLPALQEELRLELGYDDYRVETPVVYNRALDEVGPKDRISFILVADNPGKKEQLAANNRYLVGQSGKLAEGFFRDRLSVDFRREVLILNKTPIHTPKTAELRRLLSLADAAGKREGEGLRKAFRESQETMAALARRLHGALGAAGNGAAGNGTVLWVSGLGELREKGLFRPWAEALGAAYKDAPPALVDRVWLFNHFSMNQFAIEVKKKADPARPLLEELGRIGTENRKRVLGW